MKPTSAAEAPTEAKYNKHSRLLANVVMYILKDTPLIYFRTASSASIVWVDSRASARRALPRRLYFRPLANFSLVCFCNKNDSRKSLQVYLDILRLFFLPPLPRTAQANYHQRGPLAKQSLFYAFYRNRVAYLSLIGRLTSEGSRGLRM
jgi:hypothetical protein